MTSHRGSDAIGRVSFSDSSATPKGLQLLDIGMVRRGWSASGGAEAYLRRLANQLAGEGHRLTLYSSGWPESDWGHGEIISLDGRTPMRFARDFQKKRKPQHDLVFSMERVPGCDVYRAGDGVHAAWLDRRKKFESRWRSWFRMFNQKHRQMLMLERGVFTSDSTRAIIANSHMVAEEIEKLYACPAAKIHVIYNGNDPRACDAHLVQSYRESWRKEQGIDPDDFLILFAGSGWGRKNLRGAIGATSGIPGAKLVVAGKGPGGDFAAPHVLHLGEVADMEPVFSACDVFLHPTWYDPFSNACLEAIGCGLPVVTTKDNGFSEILTSMTGSVVPAADSIDAMREQISHWRNRAGPATPEACRKLASEYSLQANAKKTLEVFRQNLATGRGICEETL